MSKIDKQITSKIESENESTVLEAISIIRKEGNPAYLSVLADKLTKTDNTNIITSITNVFYDLKNIDSVPVLQKLITNKKYNGIKNTLVCSCWNNPLNYASYIIDFVKIVINDDYETAIEAFSVIDQMDGMQITDKIEESKQLVSIAIANTESQKISLLQELTKLLDSKAYQSDY